MSSFEEIDDIDEEVDRDMGWADKKRKGKKPREKSLVSQCAAGCVKAIRPVWRAGAAVLRVVGRIAFFPIISQLCYSRQFDVGGDIRIFKRTWPWRVMDAVLTRIILAPVIVGIFLVFVVHATTHPARLLASQTPDSLGIYYKRVDLATIDNQRLAGWYIPPMTVEEVAFDPESTLTQKWPGVVLCHGLGATQDQYLPLAGKLHSAGFAILMLETRGQGESAVSAVTYGAGERLDTLAGVKYLRELESVDGSKICVIGHDISGSAALAAVALDSSITAVVADGLWPKFTDRANAIFSQPFGVGGASLRWLAPLYTATFEVMTRDGSGLADPEMLVKTIHTQPVLFIARRGSDYMPAQDVLALATAVGSRHQVALADSSPKSMEATDRTICDFLIAATGWKGPAAHGVKQIQDLMQNRVN